MGVFSHYNPNVAPMTCHSMSEFHICSMLYPFFTEVENYWRMPSLLLLFDWIQIWLLFAHLILDWSLLWTANCVYDYSAWQATSGWHSNWQAASSWCTGWQYLLSNSGHLHDYHNPKATRFDWFLSLGKPANKPSATRFWGTCMQGCTGKNYLQKNWAKSEF